MAVLLEAWILLKSALSPRALLLSPSTLKSIELAPTALLNSPVELLNSAKAACGVVSARWCCLKACQRQPPFLQCDVEQKRPGSDTCVEVGAPLLRPAKKPNLNYKNRSSLPARLWPSAVLVDGNTTRIWCIYGACAWVSAKLTRISGMRRNPRRNGSERAGSRPHETNVLS